MKLKRNPYYWKQGEDGKPLPYLDELEFQIIPDDATRLLKLKAGEIDGTEFVPYARVQELKTDPEPAHGALALHPRRLPDDERAPDAEGRQAEPAVERQGPAGAQLCHQQGRGDPDHDARPGQADAVVHVVDDARSSTGRRRSIPTISPRPRR